MPTDTFNPPHKTTFVYTFEGETYKMRNMALVVVKKYVQSH